MVLNFDEIKSKYNLKINGIIHAGGHYGQEAETYKKNKILNVIFFEPLKRNFSVLMNNIYDYKAINCGLGNTSTVIEMYVEFFNNSQSSSMMKPEKHLIHYPMITFNQIEFVKIEKLDSFELSNFNFLYMDVQGYELEILKGATDTIKQIDYIMCEVNLDEHYVNCAKIYELDEFLLKNDFIRLDTHIFSQLWGDAFYIKKNLIQ